MSFFGSGRGIDFPPVVKNIIIINVIVFLAFWLPIGMTDFMQRHLALYHPLSSLFEPHQLITHMFILEG